MPDDAGDGGGTGDDLQPPADLTTPPPADLATPPDMVCPGGGVELCFNGIDDDCDGHVDCDDPDCAPVAVCVPQLPGGSMFDTYGTMETKTAACPTGTSGTTVYQNTDNTGGGCSGSCSCNAGGCTGNLTLVIPCPGGTPQSGPMVIGNDHCYSIDGYNNFRAGPVSGTMTCGSSGTDTPVMPPAIPTMRACNDNAAPVAGGCSAGDVCVPRGSNKCVSAPGSVATCPAVYPTMQGTPWFSSLTDNRTCSCSCSNTGCGASTLELFKQGGCGGTGTVPPGDVCSNDAVGAKIVGGCTLKVVVNNPLVFASGRTVCCE